MDVTMKTFTTKRAVCLGLLAFLLLGANFGGRAQSKDQPVSLKMTNKDPMFKIGSELSALKREFEVRQRSRTDATAEFKPQNSLIQTRPGGYVVVEAVAEGPRVHQLLADLKALGMVKTTTFGRMVSGQVPVAALDKMARLKSLRFAQPAYRPFTKVGAVTSGGDRAMRADLARQNADVTGRRSKIGVLSDSYNNLDGAATGIQSGDLPGPGNPNGFTTPVQVLEDLPAEDEGSDEGRAMLEIIHDVAPGAQLAFATAFTSQAGFARNILNLQAAGCNVITDDIIYFAEPFFQDGIIAQAVDSVKGLGVAYFSAAGNNGRDSYEAPFKEGGPTTAGSTPIVNAHNFAPEGQPVDLTQRITIPVGGTVIGVLQYDQPFYSLGDGSSPGAATDVDIYLLNDAGTRVLAGSLAFNIGRDPFEVFGFTNNGTYGSNQFNLLIDKYEGPTPGLIKYILFGNATFNEYATGSATCYGHANAAGAVATGAAFYAETPAFGQTPPLKETYSSAGGIPILFDLNGKPIAPVVRPKPEVVAPDGVVTTFFYQLISGQYYFFGTSAAAPHAAAVAALMQEAHGGGLSPDAIRETLQETTVDMEEPGFDFNTGYGLIDAEAAVQAVTRAGVRYFALVDTDSQRDVQEIDEGDVLNLSYLPELTIRAQTYPATSGSVGFVFNGRRITDNTAPYSLAGETDSVYNSLSPPLSADVFNGAYRLSATPYGQPDQAGDPGQALTVNFQVIQNTVFYFQLINVETGASLGTIRDGDVINLGALLSNRLNIKAVTNFGDLGSVVFDFNGKNVVENFYPYALGGDNYSQSYKELDPPLTAGDYRLTATPYAYAAGAGKAGKALTVRFSVVNGDETLATANGRRQFEGSTRLEAFPNPFQHQTTLEFRLNQTQHATLKVYDLKGSLVAPLHDGPAKEGQAYRYVLNGDRWQPGLYISRLVTSNGVVTRKLMLTR